jgi:hypothetical protein
MPFGREDVAVFTDVRCCRSGRSPAGTLGEGCLPPVVGTERQGAESGWVSICPATAEHTRDPPADNVIEGHVLTDSQS